MRDGGGRRCSTKTNGANIQEPMMSQSWNALLEDFREYEACEFLKSHLREHPSAIFARTNESASDPAWSRTDETIAALCQEYESKSDVREEMRQACRGRLSFHHFAHRMANRCLRTKDYSSLELAMLALSLEDNAFDPRETITCVCMAAFCARRLGRDFVELCRWATNVSSREMAVFFESMAQRSLMGFELREYLLRHVVDKHGERIEWTLA